jgi:hypothetical protein
VHPFMFGLFQMMVSENFHPDAGVYLRYII